jgi:hypothetical protein
VIGRQQPSRTWSLPPLFDKWIEERETQAAESWRIQLARERWRINETLAISAFQPSP